MRKAPISDLFSSLYARVFSRPAAILKAEKTLGTRLAVVLAKPKNRESDVVDFFFDVCSTKEVALEVPVFE